MKESTNTPDRMNPSCRIFPIVILTFATLSLPSAPAQTLALNWQEVLSERTAWKAVHVDAENPARSFTELGSEIFYRDEYGRWNRSEITPELQAVVRFSLIACPRNTALGLAPVSKRY